MNNMNTFNTRWLRFKQELPSIVCLSTISVWWCFHYPLYMRMQTPWNTLVPLGVSILGVACIIYLFSFMDKLAPSFKLDSIKVTTQVIVFSAVMFFAWHRNWLGMSNIHYAIFYAYCFITFALIYRAAYRVNSGR